MSTTTASIRETPGRQEQLSTRIVFFIAGFGMAAWAPLVPFAKTRANIDDGLLGLLLLCLGAGSIVAMPLAVLLLRMLLGPANAVSRRGSLWALRGTILVVVIVVLFNPVRIDESPGPVERPEMFYLLDTSASMQMGSPLSRWDESLRLIDQGWSNRVMNLRLKIIRRIRQPAGVRT